MLTLWSFADPMPPPLLVCTGYEDRGEALVLFIETNKNVPAEDERYAFSFPKPIAALQLVESPSELMSDNARFHLERKANAEPPLVPFFVSDDSPLIDRARELLPLGERGEGLRHYIMVTSDYWIEIVTQNPPIVTAHPRREHRV